MHSDQDDVDDNKLKTLEVSGGFTVPPHYFSRLRTHIQNQTIGTEDESNGIPDGYFSQSRSAILLKTVGAKTFPLWYQKPLYKYAAAAVVIAGLSVVFWTTLYRSEMTSITANISDEEILRYLEKTDLRDITISEVNFTSDPLPNAEVEQYIINQSDEHLLLEEL